MVKIISGRGTGKTTRLLNSVQDNSIILCANPDYVRDKASRSGIMLATRAIKVEPYSAYFAYKDENYKIYVDEMEGFAEFLGISGYTDGEDL